MAAANATRVLLGCFRTGEANDPEVYTAAMIATLADFPEHIIKAVCDPRTGLPGYSKWLPTVSEVREQCTILLECERRADQRQVDLERQIAARRAWEEARKAAPTYDELLARQGANWGLKTMSGLEEEARRRQHLKAVEMGNRLVLERECEAAGVDPDKIAVSPALDRLVRGKFGSRSDAA